MSLILDALRKADSERERESVPGLHTQSMPLPLDDLAPPAREVPWRWIALGVIGLLVAALVWALFLRSAPPAAPARAPDPVAMPAAPAPAPFPPPNAPMTNAAPPNAALTNAAPPAAAVEVPKDIAPPAAWREPDRKGARTAAPGAKGDTTAVATATVPTLTPIYSRDQLPDAIRNTLPPLVVSGSIFSSTPANRTLILDGRLYRENDAVGTDLVLEEIGAKTAVLRSRGYRFEIRY